MSCLVICKCLLPQVFFYIVKFAVVTTLQNKSFSSALAVTLYKQALPIEVTGESQIKQLYPVYLIRI